MKKALLLMILCLTALPSLSVVRLAGSDPYANKDLRKEFWEAVEINDTEKVKKLIKRDKSLVFAKNDKGRTGFLRAVEKHFKSMAWLLGKNWSRINEQCPRGNALQIAVEDRDFGMVQLVLSVAQLDSDDAMIGLINAPRIDVPKESASFSKSLDTSLHIAAELCDYGIYDYLVAMGGNADRVNSAFQKPKDILATCPPPEKKQGKANSAKAVSKQTPVKK